MSERPDANKGDIVRHIHSGVEYVFYDLRDRHVGGETIVYPVFLLEKPNGRLSKPFVVIGGMDAVMFVERGAPREPGEKPVRPLTQPSTPGSGEIKAKKR